jgi:Glycosyl transferase family 11
MGRAGHRYIVSELHGRLGAQLFEFASCYALARDRDAELRFYNGSVPADDLLLPGLIGAVYQEGSPAELLRVGRFPWDLPSSRAWQAATHRIVDRARAVGDRGKGSVTLWRPPATYLPELLELPLPVCIRGYLQTERYFAKYADEIMSILQWPPRSPSLPADIGPTIAVSFRRGDYNSFGWTLPLEYYDDALELVMAQLPDATIVLFGDDPGFVQLAARWLSKYAPTIDGLAFGADPVAQLTTFSQCDHCVISNSSFAWWGAWLGDHMMPAASRTVVAPSEYGEGSDRLPERWLKVKSGSAVF